MQTARLLINVDTGHTMRANTKAYVLFATFGLPMVVLILSAINSAYPIL